MEITLDSSCSWNYGLFEDRELRRIIGAKGEKVMKREKNVATQFITCTLYHILKR
jgi:hypothetical protein